MKKAFSDIVLFFKAYPIAKRIVMELHDETYLGIVKCQIAYQKVHTVLLKKGMNAIEGSVIYLAIGWAYYHNRKSP